MKILFIAGSLEPGKDGVGDYTRTLASECNRLGHQTFLTSLNDTWVEKSVMGAGELRLGARLSWPDRVNSARRFLAAVSPSLVSLQFVPYSFHRAGLNFALPRILRAIIGQTPVHCMFHEIWVGAQADAPARTRIFGFCQRKIIRDVVRTFACRSIHTSNSVYARLLAHYGVKAELLPLFGSVPVDEFPKEMKEGNRLLSLGLFGSIHPEWNPGQMLTKLKEVGRPIRLSHVGRLGPGESVWKKLEGEFASEIELCQLGEQSLGNISRFLLSQDFGVATTPLSLIGKSSTTAAMLDHGLPVIVSRNDVHFRGIREEADCSDRLIPVDDRFISRIAAAKRLAPKPRRPEIAAKFLNDVSDCKT